jgi:hypothetical protein
VHLEPAALDRDFEAGAVLGRAASVTKQKWLVDFAALNRLDRIGDLKDPARGFFRVGGRGRLVANFIDLPVPTRAFP